MKKELVVLAVLLSPWVSGWCQACPSPLDLKAEQPYHGCPQVTPLGWQTGAGVTVYISNAFSPAQRDAIQKAYENWARLLNAPVGFNFEYVSTMPTDPPEPYSEWQFGFDNGTEPEIPEVPNRVISTATFATSRSVLSASEKSIYTEITMGVQDVFEDKSGSGHPISGHNITLMLNGGTVALGSGRILSDNTQPSELSLQPAHTYLLVLQYHKEGDWYEDEGDWDVTDGVVRANTRWEQYLEKHGRAHLNGLTLDQLGPAVDKQLYGQR